MTRRADQLRDYLRGSKLPTDKMDTVFVGRIVDRLSHYVQGNDNVNMLEFYHFYFFIWGIINKTSIFATVICIKLKLLRQQAKSKTL